MKHKRGKIIPTNKERDAAMGHLFQRVQQAEAMLQAQIEVFEKYMVFRKQDKKFNKFLTKEMEKQVEEHKLQEQNEETVGEDTTDEGQRAEGIRTPL